MKIIINNYRYILFNPAQFTILYIRIYRHLEKTKKINDGGAKIRLVLNYLLTINKLTIREILISITYLLQNKSKHKDLIHRISENDPDYISYLKEFID